MLLALLLIVYATATCTNSQLVTITISGDERKWCIATATVLVHAHCAEMFIWRT